jgi:hypothetical protein
MKAQNSKLVGAVSAKTSAGEVRTGRSSRAKLKKVSIRTLVKGLTKGAVGGEYWDAPVGREIW